MQSRARRLATIIAIPEAAADKTRAEWLLARPAVSGAAIFHSECTPALGLLSLI